MNWKLWLKGLAAASISSAAAGVTQVISTTGNVNKSTAAVAGAGALIGLLGYMTKSPLTPAPEPAQAALDFKDFKGK